ncbi:MAG: phenylalanine--tRNA ligase subunit beta [Bacilli bacterium]|nr:phenylalanine--tRNA ligase subunit beta [Bacilli bacterium]MDD3304725.1 phenylalanine--tRNA ligase subunit beta [Bacilli bacterium]MDD4053596.1 phenylalanine--tRNA ligase subunit beta [Bacilli bacterium]MDD4411095.1 phenylalanine--tRNA ligase subunit beta [Bacilli bacterium]
MRISLNWLNDYVDVKDENAVEVAEKITKAGVNVEGIKGTNIKNLVIGYVENRTDHPNSDHLNVCTVNIGTEVLQIVCGASNADKGQKVIVAKVGAILPGDFEIKKATIRGVESVGMICALYELGLEDKEANYDKGIHVLPADAEVGGDPLAYLGLDDIIYELDLNPNRNDCLCHLGFAYETAAVLGKTVTLPETKTTPSKENIKDVFGVEVETDNCTMFKTRIVKDVVIGESPAFIKNRLTSAGMRSINNVVDISNYIMLEYGQPLHFYDKDKVGDKIVVRMATDGEKTVTLDGKERKLIADDVLITNGNDTLGIAGVMGGASSEVDSNTKNILIESAMFNPYNIRYTSIRLDLRSEASLRFEKGLNYEYTEEALERACYLLEKYASGTVMEGHVSYDVVDKTPKTASVSRDKINAVLGMVLKHEDIMASFKKLDFKVIEEDNVYNVVIPNRRMDVSIREDLIEEVGRLYGYDKIVQKLPIAPMKQGGYNPKTSFCKQISNRMRSLGLNEVRTYSLISKEESNLFKYNKNEELLLQLPLSVDKSVFRQSIIPSLLKVVDYNLARNAKDINIYEISNVYYKKNEDYIEDTKLSFAMFGNYINNNWQNRNIKIDFYVVKGIVENLLDYLGLNGRYTVQKGTNIPNEMHPGISAEVIVDNEFIGYFGTVHPSINKLPIFVGEFSTNRLFSHNTGGLKYKETSKFPSITKDIAFIFKKDVEAKDIIKVIRKKGGKILQDVDVFDVYIGDKIDDDSKSIALSLTFMDTNKTLTDDEVNALLNNIISEVETKLKGVLRNK